MVVVMMTAALCGDFPGRSPPRVRFGDTQRACIDLACRENLSCSGVDSITASSDRTASGEFGARIPARHVW